MSEDIKVDQEIKLPAADQLVLSSSPHLSTSDTVRKIMYKVLLALLPAVLAGVWFFGLKALLVIVSCTVFCVGAEALWCVLAKKPVKNTILDGSAAVTGVLLALNLPAGVPLYVPLIGAFLAIWLGKQVYGGIGNNPFNPAIVARVGLLIAFPALLTTWYAPRNFNKSFGYDNFVTFEQRIAVQKGEKKLDAVTCATPLGLVKTTHKDELSQGFFAHPQMLKDYFIGNRPGCIGETCVPALLLGFFILLAFKLINWRIPVCYVGTVAVISAVAHMISPAFTPEPLFHLLTGGLLLGAIFMATDMVTSPITPVGAIVFGVGCGIVTAVIRLWGNYPEGVSFSILLMNALVPLIDRYCGIRPFGYTVKREKKEVAK
ncbi:MAG: RnfABCDGE type electron transport complex subunit D [Lentisphaeria bacterium]|nr:RnfABCDGE type electron transport complex subunit D [Lentisphaeria bacterium]